MTEPSQTPHSKKTRWGIVLIANLLLFFGLLLAVEGAARFLLKRETGETKPFFVDRSVLRAENVGVRQVGGTTVMSYLDPHLGHAHDPQTDEEISGGNSLPGFVVNGDRDDPSALRIFALGGSTTDPIDKENWPKALYEILTDRGVPAVVFNGGVSGYSTNQELLKLIRDVLPLDPDVVLSMSGVNDLGFLHSLSEHPMVHPFQSRVLQKLTADRTPAFLPNTLTFVHVMKMRAAPAHSRILGVTYGPPVSTDPPSQWARNVRLMHAAAEEFGVRYFCFLQPVLGVGNYTPSEADDQLLAEADEAQRNRYLGWLQSFYDGAQPHARNHDFIHDLTDVFQGRSDLYRDARHPNGEGYRLIAEAVADILESERVFLEAGKRDTLDALE